MQISATYYRVETTMLALMPPEGPVATLDLMQHQGASIATLVLM